MLARAAAEEPLQSTELDRSSPSQANYVKASATGDTYLSPYPVRNVNHNRYKSPYGNAHLPQQVSTWDPAQHVPQSTPSSPQNDEQIRWSNLQEPSVVLQLDPSSNEIHATYNIQQFPSQKLSSTVVNQRVPKIPSPPISLHINNGPVLDQSPGATSLSSLPSAPSVFQSHLSSIAQDAPAPIEESGSQGCGLSPTPCPPPIPQGTAPYPIMASRDLTEIHEQKQDLDLTKPATPIREALFSDDDFTDLFGSSAFEESLYISSEASSIDSEWQMEPVEFKAESPPSLTVKKEEHDEGKVLSTVPVFFTGKLRKHAMDNPESSQRAKRACTSSSPPSAQIVSSF